MPTTIKYIGTQRNYFELAVTGKQSNWEPGQTEERADAEAALLLATGLFSAATVPVTAQTNPLTGRITSSFNDPQVLFEAADAPRVGRSVIPESFARNLDPGVKIVDVANATLNVTAAAQRIKSGLVYSDSVLRLLPGGNADFDGINVTMPSTEFAIGFWAYKPSHHARSNVAIYVTNLGFTNYMKTNIVIEPGLRYYAIPRLNFDQFGTGFNLGNVVNKIRIRDLADAGDYPVMEAGSNILIGNIHIAQKPKAVWVWGFDDCKLNLYTPTVGGTEVIGGNGIAQAHSFASFIESYGWRGTAYVIGGLLGDPGFCTTPQLLGMQDKGWTIGQHSWSHPNHTDVSPFNMYGLNLLGPKGYAMLTTPYQFTAAYTGALMTARNDSLAIRDDVQQGMAVCEAAGFKGYRHFCTPQAAADRFVQEALRSCGVQTVRGSRHTILNESKFALSNGAVSGGGKPNGQMITAIDSMASSVLLDGGGTNQADLITYVDRVIALGGVGATQIHDWDIAGTRTAIKHAADYIKQKEAEGLIQVMTAEELYEKQRSQFTPF